MKKKNRFITKGITGLLALSSCTVWAASGVDALNDLTGMPIEKLLNVEVQTASKFMQRISEAPSAVSVITSKEIKYYGWRTLADVLAALPGMHKANDRNYSYVGARGYLRSSQINTRYLLLVDGHRMNDKIFGAAYLGRSFFLDVDLIDRVEYVPGPGSSIYGSAAFFGVINVITKKPDDYKKATVSGELASADGRKASLTKGWETEDGKALLLSATHFYSGGEDLYFSDYDTPEQNNGVAEGLDYERANRIFIKGKAGAYTMMLGHTERKKGVPTASYWQLFNHPQSNTVETQTHFNLGYKAALSQKADVRAKIFYDRYKYTGDYLYEGDPVDLRIREDMRATSRGGEFELMSTHFKNQKLLAGVRYERSSPLWLTSHNVEPYQLNCDVQEKKNEISFYLQDEISFGERWLLNMGVRHDKVANEDDGVTLPRLGLIYQATPRTTIKALYGKAYLAPSAFEKYFYSYEEGGQMPNPDLQPEYIRTYEMVIEHALSPSSQLRLSAYKNKVSNLITQKLVEEGGLHLHQFENLKSATAKGAEIEWLGSCEHSDGLMWRTSYSWQQTRDGETGEILQDSPRHLIKAQVSLPIPESKWRLGLQADYVGPREGKTTRVGGYTLANLTVFSAKLIKNAEISATIYNLFDRKYADPAGEEFLQEVLEQDGRSWRVKINYRF